MKKQLDFLVIGVQKSATTWIYNCLREHPELYLPAKKREVEYLGGDLYETRGADWYFSLLQGAKVHQKIGDVSVEYIFDPRSPQTLQQHAPHLKLIVSLREPIDRAISAYYWQLRKGVIPNLPLEEGLRIAIDATNESQDPKLRKCYEDLIRRGFYDVQLERYLQYFKLEQFLFVLYEDLQNKPLSVIQKIYEFIGVNSTYQPKSLQRQPKRNTYLTASIYLQRLAPKSLAVGKFMDLTNQLLHQLGIENQKPALSESLLQQLRTIYKLPTIQTNQIVQQAPEKQQPFSTNLIELWNKQYGQKTTLDV